MPRLRKTIVPLEVLARMCKDRRGQAEDLKARSQKHIGPNYFGAYFRHIQLVKNRQSSHSKGNRLVPLYSLNEVC